ncbi:SPOR domain-containing protein [Roseospira marina]|nr:SPOR domain-containing protein [Roseospira marina]MBB5086295.1 cell division septation protein DedD [Roseospira marina]
MMGSEGRRDPFEEPPPSREPVDREPVDFDFDLDDDDLVAEPRARQRDGLPYVGLLGGLAALVVVAGGLWLVFAPSSDDTVTMPSGGSSVAVLEPMPSDGAASGAASGTADGPELPVVRAEDSPYREAPESPGGMQVENKDKLIYGRLDGEGEAGEGAGVEELLPAPARPQPPPQPDPKPELAPQRSEGAPDAVPGAPPMPGGAGDVAEEAPGGTSENGGVPAPFLPETPESESAEPEAAPEPPPAPAAPAVPSVTERPPAPPPAPAAPEPQPEPENVAATAQQGPQVQLAAFRERSLAERQWAQLKAAHPDLLGSVPHVIVFADLGDRGQFYRLRAGPLGSADAAQSLCQALKLRDVECLIVRE